MLSNDFLCCPVFVQGFAEAITGAVGEEARDRLAKQLVLGSYRVSGDESLALIFAEPLISVGGRRLLAKIAFEVADRFRWDFSDREWCRSERGFEEQGCNGLALIGFDQDARFFLVDPVEAVPLICAGEGVLSIPLQFERLSSWESSWQNWVTT